MGTFTGYFAAISDFAYALNVTNTPYTILEMVVSVNMTLLLNLAGSVCGKLYEGNGGGRL
jgi:hypothetical protein